MSKVYRLVIDTTEEQKKATLEKLKVGLYLFRNRLIYVLNNEVRTYDSDINRTRWIGRAYRYYDFSDGRMYELNNFLIDAAPMVPIESKAAIAEAKKALSKVLHNMRKETECKETDMRSIEAIVQ